MNRRDEELTAEIVFERLERLRELLRLVDHLREFRPVSPDTTRSDTDDEPRARGRTRG